jgi:ankyrin repeat protein
VKLLLDSGANIKAKDRFGFSPFHRSALSQDASTAELLLERGADMYVMTERSEEVPSESVLNLALGSSNIPMVWLLLAKGFDVSGFSWSQILWYKPPDSNQYMEMQWMIANEQKRRTDKS